MSSRAVQQARHSQNAWTRHVRRVKPVELIVTSVSS